LLFIIKIVAVTLKCGSETQIVSQQKMHLDIQMLETEKEIVNSEPHFEERR